MLRYEDNFSTAQSDTEIITVAAGKQLAVTSYLAIQGTDALTAANTNFFLRMGSGPGTEVAGHAGIPKSGGIGEGTGRGTLWVGAVDEDLFMTCDDPGPNELQLMITYEEVNL